MLRLARIWSGGGGRVPSEGRRVSVAGETPLEVSGAKALGIIVAIFATLFFFLGAVTLVPAIAELRDAYKSGHSSVVEDIVENFHPAPDLGAAEEFFYVGGINFSYNALSSLLQRQTRQD